MNARVVMADVVYVVDYVRARGRSRHRDTVLEVAPVSITELHPDDAPVVLEARVSSPVYAWRDRVQSIRAIGGGLAMRAADWEGRPLALADLQRPQGPVGRWTGSPYPFGPVLPRREDGWPRDHELRIRQVVHSGRDNALKDAREQAARCAVIGEEFWVPAGQFHWDIMRGNGGFRIRGCQRHGIEATPTPFDVAHRDAAVAHVARLRTYDARYAKFGKPIVEDNIRILEPDAVPNAYMPLARAALDFQARCWTDRGFAHIPVEAMQAWIGFRRAAAPALEGDAAAVPGAFEALRELLRQVMRSDLAFETDETTMGHWARSLPETMAWYDAYLSRIAPAPAPDMAPSAPSC